MDEVCFVIYSRSVVQERAQTANLVKAREPYNPSDTPAQSSCSLLGSVPLPHIDEKPCGGVIRYAIGSRSASGNVHIYLFIVKSLFCIPWVHVERMSWLWLC